MVSTSMLLSGVTMHRNYKTASLRVYAVTCISF